MQKSDLLILFINGLGALFLLDLCPLSASAVFIFGTEETALGMIYTPPNEGTAVTFTAKRQGNTGTVNLIIKPRSSVDFVKSGLTEAGRPMIIS